MTHGEINSESQSSILQRRKCPSNDTQSRPARRASNPPEEVSDLLPFDSASLPKGDTSYLVRLLADKTCK